MIRLNQDCINMILYNFKGLEHPTSRLIKEHFKNQITYKYVFDANNKLIYSYTI